ncbi:hypothetical protein ACFE04_028286 [Oxalis oulophora]
MDIVWGFIDNNRDLKLHVLDLEAEKLALEVFQAKESPYFLGDGAEAPRIPQGRRFDDGRRKRGKVVAKGKFVIVCVLEELERLIAHQNSLGTSVGKADQWDPRPRTDKEYESTARTTSRGRSTTSAPMAHIIGPGGVVGDARSSESASQIRRRVAREKCVVHVLPSDLQFAESETDDRVEVLSCPSEVRSSGKVALRPLLSPIHFGGGNYLSSLWQRCLVDLLLHLRPKLVYELSLVEIKVLVKAYVGPCVDVDLDLLPADLILELVVRVVAYSVSEDHDEVQLQYLDYLENFDNNPESNEDEYVEGVRGRMLKRGRTLLARRVTSLWNRVSPLEVPLRVPLRNYRRFVRRRCCPLIWERSLAMSGCLSLLLLMVWKGLSTQPDLPAIVAPGSATIASSNEAMAPVDESHVSPRAQLSIVSLVSSSGWSCDFKLGGPSAWTVASMSLSVPGASKESLQGSQVALRETHQAEMVVVLAERRVGVIGAINESHQGWFISGHPIGWGIYPKRGPPSPFSYVIEGRLSSISFEDEEEEVDYILAGELVRLHRSPASRLQEMSRGATDDLEFLAFRSPSISLDAMFLCALYDRFHISHRLSGYVPMLEGTSGTKFFMAFIPPLSCRNTSSKLRRWTPTCAILWSICDWRSSGQPGESLLCISHGFRLSSFRVMHPCIVLCAAFLCSSTIVSSSDQLHHLVLWRCAVGTMALLLYAPPFSLHVDLHDYSRPFYVFHL